MSQNNLFQNVAGANYQGGTPITNQPLYATPLTGSPNSPEQVTQNSVNQLQTQALSGQLQKQSLGTFEISYSPFNDPNYPLTQAVANANQNIYSIGWINLNFAGLTDFYQGAVNTASYTLIDTQITSPLFYITDIEMNYYEPDYGFNNYTILINGTKQPSFTNFRNNNPKHNPEGYLFNNASRFTLSVSSITCLIQPVMVTILGYGAIATQYNDGVSSTLSSLEILV